MRKLLPVKKKKPTTITIHTSGATYLDVDIKEYDVIREHAYELYMLLGTYFLSKRLQADPLQILTMEDWENDAQKTLRNIKNQIPNN